jgi:hypothetical protein
MTFKLRSTLKSYDFFETEMKQKVISEQYFTVAL